ncbi:MAG: hypothetical protein WC712_00495 [Candidatus Brocadiia bacterium]
MESARGGYQILLRVMLSRGLAPAAVMGWWIVYAALMDEAWSPLWLAMSAILALTVCNAALVMPTITSPCAKSTLTNRIVTCFLLATVAGPGLTYFESQRPGGFAAIGEIGAVLIALALIAIMGAGHGWLCASVLENKSPDEKDCKKNRTDEFAVLAEALIERADDLKTCASNDRPVKIAEFRKKEEELKASLQRPEEPVPGKEEKEGTFANRREEAAYINAAGIIVGMIILGIYYSVTTPPRSRLAFWAVDLVVALVLATAFSVYHASTLPAVTRWIVSPLYALGITLLMHVSFGDLRGQMVVAQIAAKKTALPMGILSMVCAVGLSVLSTLHGYDAAVRYAETDYLQLAAIVRVRAGFVGSCDPKERPTALADLGCAVDRLSASASVWAVPGGKQNGNV